MPDPDIIIKPRDVMPAGAVTLPAAYYTDPGLLPHRDGAAVRTRVDLRGAQRAGRRARAVLRSRSARREHHHHARVVGRRAGVLQRLPPSRHAAVLRARAASSPAASSARITPGPTPSTDGWSARRTWTTCRTSTRRTTRCIGSPPTSGTATSSSRSPPDPPPLTEQLADLPGKFTSWRMQDLRLGHRIVYDLRANWKLIVQNYNECLHCPNLHPALNRLSHYLSGENEPLHRVVHGRPHGPAARRGDDVDGRDVPAGDPAGAVSGGAAAASTTTRSSRTCCSACTRTT